jgi:hypothetical protein
VTDPVGAMIIVLTAGIISVVAAGSVVKWLWRRAERKRYDI